MPCRCIHVRINKPTDLRIIITTGYIIEPRLRIVIVATVTEGIDGCHGTSCSQHSAIGIIGICSNAGSGCVDKVHYITLQVGDVVVSGSVISDGEGCPAGGIGEVQHVGTIGLPEKLSSGIHILMLHAIDGFARPQTVQVIGVGNACSRLAGGCELASILPSEVPASPVIVADRITADCRTGDGVGGAVVGLTFVGNAVAVERGQQVCPAGISVGISMVLVGLGIVVIVDIPVDQIAGVIVEILIPVLCHAAGIVHGGVTELIQYIVGIACVRAGGVCLCFCRSQ